MKPYFPEVSFAWAFVAILMMCMAIASYLDLKTARIPKWLTLGMLGLGIVVNIIRGACMGSQGKELVFLNTGSVWLGAFDGFLFGFLGGLAAFALFFLMWILGSCGGGDVKLMAGVGGWLGAWYSLLVVPVSVVTLIVWIVIKALTTGVSAKRVNEAARSAKKGDPQRLLTAGRLTFSIPATAAVLLVMLWAFRNDLQLNF